MARIARDSLLTLEAYARERKDFRARVLAHKKPRSVHLGEHVVLLFEDELTIRYQVQEMLRIEKIFEEAGIQEELDAYNPLVPDGNNWKATMQVEYEDVEERRRVLARLKGIEDRVWVKVEGQPRVYAIADEDLERENDEKTSAVHFLRFERHTTPVVARLGTEQPHPAFLHDASRRDVARKMRGRQLVEIEQLEGEHDDRLRRRGCVAAIPVGTSDPVAEALMFAWTGAQADRAYEQVIAAFRDRVSVFGVRRSGRFVRRDPRRSGAIGIGMRNERSRLRDLALSGEDLHPRRIGHHEVTQGHRAGEQTFREQGCALETGS